MRKGSRLGNRSVVAVLSRSELARPSRSLLGALCAAFFGWAHLVTTDANTGDLRCRESRRSDPTTNFTKLPRTSLILTLHGSRGAWTLSAKLTTRACILSPTSQRCLLSSRKQRCFVFPTE